jgi:hypothetical protein
MPPGIPPPPPPPPADCFSGFSVTTASVVRRRPAMDAAFWGALGVTSIGPDHAGRVFRLNDLMVREIRAFVAARYPELRGYAAD